MCQLVFHVVDSGTASDPLVDSLRFKPGDVVEVLPDTYVFGASDLGPHNKVVKMPGVTVSAMAQLLASDPMSEPLTGWVNFPRIRVWNVPGYAGFAAVLPVAVPSTWITANAVQRTAVANAIGNTPTVVVP